MNRIKVATTTRNGALAALFLAASLVCWTAAVAQAAPTTAAEPDQPGSELVPPTSASDFTSGQLEGVIGESWRAPTERARDVYRHPKQTLQFFGIRPDQTVIEITPGGGWYSEILAPLLHDNGRYIAAIRAPRKNDGEAALDDDALHRKFAADPVHYGKAQFVQFNPNAPSFGAPASADMLLTFRNVHNWAGTAPLMFKAFFTVLKPGGVLGVVDHRADDRARVDAVEASGYLPVSYVVKLATDAGFVLDKSSEINANPRDSHDHPKGVWTLPPTFALGEKDRAKYQAIGESDRMTLRFIKPQAAPVGSVPAAATTTGTVGGASH
jgi:predicted methyltransferase